MKKTFTSGHFTMLPLLRKGNLTEIDRENIAEELGSMGRSEKRELVSHLTVLLMYLLKWQYQPERRSRSWKTTINTQRLDIELLIKDSPSLKHNIEIVLNEVYGKAKKLFEVETNINHKKLPKDCPYGFDRVMDSEFWPD